METRITYRGFLYKATAEHKRCAVGTHWNEIKHACVKLPNSLARARQTAKATSAKANGASKSAASLQQSHSSYTKAHHSAWAEHAKAETIHAKLADKLAKRGFHKLSAQHRQTSNTHAGIANIHFMKHQPLPKGKLMPTFDPPGKLYPR